MTTHFLYPVETIWLIFIMLTISVNRRTVSCAIKINKLYPRISRFALIKYTTITIHHEM
jgi:hypothetical protein